jgi:hypothetical protein
MKLPFDLTEEITIDISEKYNFNKESLEKIGQNKWVKGQWPLVYFIQNEANKEAYVGESTNFSIRVKNHLANPKKSNAFNQISIIGSNKFNKSATLDIESKLIQYISSEGNYNLHNRNDGLINHNYYQQNLYKDIFIEIWERLKAKKIVTKSLAEIENSELFKYSPYKSLNEDQYNSVIQIVKGFTTGKSNRIFIKGSAGTGKTILATYLIKLLSSDASNTITDDYSDNEIYEINLIRKFQEKYPNAKIGIVIAMTSLRKTLKNVFKSIPDLKASMVINPSESFKHKYDLLIVDEAHRLRQYKNIGWMGAFKNNNRKLGLDDSGNELDWVIANSKNQIFFYDSAQSIKPSDIGRNHFDNLLNGENTLNIELTSQMRVQGDDANDYITFVDELLTISRDNTIFQPDAYDLLVFDSFSEMYKQLTIKEESYGLARLISGYSWPWISESNEDVFDIEIEGLKFKWNSKSKEDWINSPNAFKEVGSIHTTQGYDLNYGGIIFGREISYNINTNEIEIDREMYFDKYGKQGVGNDDDLKNYLINIYKTIMYRGIKGTFVYAVDENLRKYFKCHIPTFNKSHFI